MHEPTKKSQFDLICEAEQKGQRAIHDIARWVDDPQTITALRRAEFLLMEVRQAAQFLTDPECATHIKNEATRRLELAITHCK